MNTQNMYICCEYSLEEHWRGASNEYQKHVSFCFFFFFLMCVLRNWKILILLVIKMPCLETYSDKMVTDNF